jgi:hypothetical protein
MHVRSNEAFEPVFCVRLQMIGSGAAAAAMGAGGVGTAASGVTGSFELTIPS